MATSNASARPHGRVGKRLTVALPPELVAPLERLARIEDRSVSGQIVNIVRRHLQQQEDDALLEAAIARSERGETIAVSQEVFDTVRARIEAGASTDEVLKDFPGA